MRRVLGPMHDEREHGLAYRVAAALWLTAFLEVPLYFLLPHPFPTPVWLVLSGSALGLVVSAFCWRAATRPSPVIVLQLALLLGIGVVAVSMAGLGGAASPSRVDLLPMVVFSASFFASPVFLLTVRDQAERVGRTDPPTGLANRRGLHEAFGPDGRPRPVGSLLYLDVDHFKRLNDEHGHDVGDTALEALGAAVRACSRRQDVAARLGGEEFVVWLDGSDEGSALVVAERLVGRSGRVGDGRGQDRRARPGRRGRLNARAGAGPRPRR